MKGSTAIIGRPNVGKSSLLNNLLREEKAIVTDIEGTTQDVIEEYVNINGVPLKLVDTAGIRETGEHRWANWCRTIEKKPSRRLIWSSWSSMQVSLWLIPRPPTPLKSLKTATASFSSIGRPPREDRNRPTSRRSYQDFRSENQNIDQIEDRINALFFENAGLVEQDATYLSNARHISLIEKAVESLQAVNEGLALGMPVDLLQVDLTRTWEILGEITGDAAPDELITQLFSQFCLGK